MKYIENKELAAFADLLNAKYCSCAARILTNQAQKELADKIQRGTILKIKNSFLKNVETSSNQKVFPGETFGGDYGTHQCVCIKRDNNNLITLVVTTTSVGAHGEDFIKLSDETYLYQQKTISDDRSPVSTQR